MGDNLTIKEIHERMDELSREMTDLKHQLYRKRSRYIATAVNNQDKLAFLYPYKRGKEWGRSTNYATEFTDIRNAALSAVAIPIGSDDKFKKRKVTELFESEKDIAISCAEEIIEVVAKYKKQFLETIGRTDIIKAFNMEDI